MSTNKKVTPLPNRTVLGTVEFFENWPIKIGREVGVLLLPTKKNWPQKLAGTHPGLLLAVKNWPKKLAGTTSWKFRPEIETVKSGYYYYRQKKIGRKNWPECILDYYWR